MEQLSIFDTLKKPTKKNVLPETNITPEDQGEYKILLGVRYSLTEVEDWVPVYHLCVYRPPHKHSVLPYRQIVWIDPKTINSIHYSKSDIKWDPGTAWGFGPRHDIDRYNYDMIAFTFEDAGDYDWVKDKVY